MRELDVGIDVDDVCADFRGRYLDVAAELLRSNVQVVHSHWDAGVALGLSAAQRRRVNKRMQQPGMCLGLDPLPEAVEGVRRLASMVGRVHFVTAPWRGAATWPSERMAWLERHFGKLGRRVISTEDKYMVDVNMLVDDKVRHLDTWLAEANPRRMAAVCWARDYNKEWVAGGVYRYRMDQWEELYALVRRLS